MAGGRNRAGTTLLSRTLSLEQARGVSLQALAESTGPGPWTPTPDQTGLQDASTLYPFFLFFLFVFPDLSSATPAYMCMYYSFSDQHLKLEMLASSPVNFHDITAAGGIYSEFVGGMSRSGAKSLYFTAVVECTVSSEPAAERCTEEVASRDIAHSQPLTSGFYQRLLFSHSILMLLVLISSHHINAQA